MLPDLKQITKIVRWEFTWLNWFEKKKKMLVCTSITKRAFSVSRYSSSAFLMCTLYLIAFWTRTWADLNKSEQTVVAAHNFPYSSVSCRYFWLNSSFKHAQIFTFKKLEHANMMQSSQKRGDVRWRKMEKISTVSHMQRWMFDIFPE